MHSCMLFVFICNVQSLYYMRVCHRCFVTPACVGRRGLEAGSYLQLVYGWHLCGGLCFGRGRDMGFVSYISLFLRVLGRWVCLYARVHTHRLLGYSM